ncbi:chromosomal replication initiator protein DnaA [Jannaschia aquimarina]|uniref:Chromosomal replication initiator protein DnaA n=1 Tax=Jannaschia aquimarina TaxID=935700 RepID=A0A0D1CLK8_9RHOB|nr:chromosomal replication initiator protein DnaA [Jannaschia aquimarina]KIT15682.1 Chromosomal replication initiator protein DnaA [Jannaschia aquimarina]SNT39201.1 chromosomal replication initiator protein DnaA [Jannaschia aquimarina]
MTGETWDLVKSGIERDVGANNFATWIKPLQFRSLDDRTLSLASPTDFIGRWVVQNFSDIILRHVDAAGIRASRVICTAGAAPVAESAPASPVRSRTEDGLDPRFTFDSFVVGKSNELAHAAARRVGEGGPVSFNPLFLHGGVGLGKTHLMQAIAWQLRERDPGCRVLFLSAEQFMYRFVQALREQSTMSFKEMFRSVDVLLVDDVQFIAGKESTQEEFFHTFNALVDNGKQVVISADRSPSDISDVQERITSRLHSGLVVDLHPADYELRLGILMHRYEQCREEAPDFILADGVIEFLAGRINTSIRVLESVMTRLFHYWGLVRREIRVEQLPDVLGDLLRASERKLTIDEIMKKVCDHYSLRMSDMTSARRSRSVARPRQMAMYLAKKLTPRSYPEIGRKFGGKDHTTVLYAVRKIEELIQSDPQLAEDAQLLQRRLES